MHSPSLSYHDAGHQVTALDLLAPKERLPDGVELQQGDIRKGYGPESPLPFAQDGPTVTCSP
jgi:hypothetical protein